MFKVHRTYDLSTGVKNNSIAVFNQGKVCVVLYHKTPVFVRAGKTIVLNNGGWDTVSTRAVINRALEMSAPRTYLTRKKGVTMIESIDVNEIKQSVPFKNNMRLKVYS